MRQFDSAYSPPCRGVFAGHNGGATHRGVTSQTITLVSRHYGDSPENLFLEQAFAQGGFSPPKVVRPVRDVFVQHFNRVYELYGRRVVIEDITTNASQLEEATGKGRERACADAADIAQRRKAFGVLPPPGASGTVTFSECAVEQGLFLPHAPLSYPERWYRTAHPYAYGVEMDCERLVRLYAEYVGKRLAGKPARWARDPGYTSTTRVFGFIHPDFGDYSHCFELLERELSDRYGVKIKSRYTYSVDPATVAQQTAQAVVQFKAAGVNSLLLAMDPFSAAALTGQARSQQWGPEWVLVGAAFQDVDGYARLYDQDRVDGHMFGLSALGSPEALRGPDSEPARLYRRLTGKTLPPNTDGDYYNLVHIFNLLQAAGPALTPEAIGAGAVALPGSGAPAFPLGGWSFSSDPDGSAGTDHTEIDDVREVYWDGSATAYDGKRGTFIATYHGRRFSNGQWPAEDPPIYPGPCEGPSCQRQTSSTAAADPSSTRSGPSRRARARSSANRRASSPKES